MGKKLKQSSYVRYLGIYLDEHLNWSPHINHLSQKLVKASTMLCKYRHFINVATVKSIYYAIFHSRDCINLLQKKAMWIISLASFDADSLPIFAKLKIIKFPDHISFCNCLFTYKHFLSKSSSVFSNVFILTFSTHEQSTRSTSHDLLTKPSCSTSKFGTNSFAASAIKSWNCFQKKFSNNNLCELSYSQLKLLIKNHFFNSYN